MTRRRGRILIAVVLAIAAVVIAARTLLLPWLHGAVERAGTRALGRNVTIAGPLGISFSPKLRVTATGVTVANVAAGSDPAMLRADRASITLDVTSLLSGPVRIREIALDGVHALIETDADGRSNWIFTPEKPVARPAEAVSRFPIDIDRATLRHLEVSYRPWAAEPITVSAGELAARLDAASHRLELQGTGELDTKSWELSGQLDSLDSLWAGADVAGALTGKLGRATVEIRGSTRGPHGLARPDLEMKLSGPDVATALGLFGLRSPLVGEFTFHGRLTPDAERTQVDLEATATGVTAHVLGSVRRLETLDGIDVGVTASGPDAARAAAWLGIEGVPQQGFSIDGRARRDAGRWSFEDATLHVGTTAVTISGELGKLPQLAGTNLAIQASGRDLAELSRVARIPLPRGTFDASGRVARRGDGRWSLTDTKLRVGRSSLAISGELGSPPELAGTELTIDARGADPADLAVLKPLRLPAGPFAVRGHLSRLDDGDWALADTHVRTGGTTLTVSGTLGALPKVVGTDLEFQATGNDLAELSALTRLPLPQGPFEIGGRFARRADGLAIDAVELRFRAASLRASGTIGEPPACPNLDLTFGASGPDAAAFSDVARATLPQAPFALDGRVVRTAEGVTLHGLRARAGDDTAEVEGLLLAHPRLAGSDLQVKVAGPDLARFGALFGVSDLPVRPFDIAGRLQPAADAYTLQGVVARVGSLTARVDGRLGAPSLGDGTALTVRVEGPALAELAAWNLPPDLASSLAAEPFSFAAQAHSDHGVVRATDALLNVGSDQVAVNGVVGALPDLALLDLTFRVSGRSASSLGRHFTGSARAPLARLPDQAYAISGQARRAPTGVALHQVQGRVGGTSFNLEGTLGTDQGLRDTDLRFGVTGPDASLLARLADTKLPGGPFATGGRIAVADAGTLFDHVTLAIGEAHAELDGLLGPAPDFTGSDFRVDAAGPSLAAVLRPAVGIETALPGRPFTISAEITGEARSFSSKRLAARLGENDLSGRLALRLGERPFLEAELHSDRLAVSGLLADFGGVEEAAPAAPPRPPGGLLIPDDALPFALLRKLDASLRFRADELVSPGLTLRDVVLTGTLRDGALRVERAEGTGLYGGRAAFSLAIEPHGDTYRIKTAGRLDGARLLFPGSKIAPADLPRLDVEFDLTGEGRSLHTIAAGGAGRLLIVLGPGAIPPELSKRLRTGMLRDLLETLNPFQKASQQSALECGIVVAEIVAGEATVEPIAIRTDALTVLGDGGLDLASEAVDLSWVIKPRKGLGLSPTALAASYVKLGGTLASPQLDMKPLSAAFSTGAAVATAGITLLSRQLYNRVTAERKVCKEALARYRKQHKPGPTPPQPPQ